VLPGGPDGNFPAVSTADRPGQPATGRPGVSHQHRDVSGGWLRPTVFGAMDGLVTNVALISGVGGGGVRPQTIVLTGLAGLVAGAFSMATGEYTSVRSQNELVTAEVAVERRELEENPTAERLELAESLRRRGVDQELAEAVAGQLSRDVDQAVRLHAQQELGIDPEELPSPYVAAVSSFLSFGLGALIPLFPYLLGASQLWVALLAAAVALLLAGGLVARLTDRPALRGALRQLLLAALAAAVTYGVGRAIGTSVS
jgi:VIT1/CCC1 family predicted Fe2+/Mn2+ transporter